MFHQNIKKLTKENLNFRKVICTAASSQLVLMALKPGEDIGAEAHPTIDQIFFLVSGEGQANIEGKITPFKEHELVVVPAGTEHNIHNTGNDPLKFFTIYAPPAHPDGTIHRTKTDALKHEATYGSANVVGVKMKEPVPA